MLGRQEWRPVLEGDGRTLERSLTAAGLTLVAACVAAWLVAAMSPYHSGGREGGGTAVLVSGLLNVLWVLTAAVVVQQRSRSASWYFWVLLVANGVWALLTLWTLILPATAVGGLPNNGLKLTSASLGGALAA